MLEDLFPNNKLDKENYDDLQKSIQKQIDEKGLINYNEWNLKIIQLYEIQCVRHGIMILGPSGAGKTTCCQTLMGKVKLMRIKKNKKQAFSTFCLNEFILSRSIDPLRYAYGKF